MKRHHFLKKTSLVAVLAVMTALSQAQAADMAAASGMLAEISVMAVQAQANLAAAASVGDLNAIADAAGRADAVDAAMKEAQQAYAALENAADEAAATAASASLNAAHQKATDALNGVVVDKSSQEEWKDSTTNTGGGPGDAYDTPNIYEVPWQSDGLKSVSTAMFNSVNSSSGGSSANSNSYGDGDATPQ